MYLGLVPYHNTGSLVFEHLFGAVAMTFWFYFWQLRNLLKPDCQCCSPNTFEKTLRTISSLSISRNGARNWSEGRTKVSCNLKFTFLDSKLMNMVYFFLLLSIYMPNLLRFDLFRLYHTLWTGRFFFSKIRGNNETSSRRWSESWEYSRHQDWVSNTSNKT